MRATTELTVTDDMRLTIRLDMNVAEMKALLTALSSVDTWASLRLKSVLRQSLEKASGAYYSEHVIES